MKCSEFEGLLSEYLENELEPAAVREMDKHQGLCISCSTLLDEVTELCGSLNNFPWVEPKESLIGSILEGTSGKTRGKNRIWGPIMIWFKPVLTQRHVFATLMILVFFSFATNMLGPEFTASGQSGLNPAFWGERATSISGDVYKKWREFDSFKQRVGDEIGLLKDDLLGRLNYHLTMALFKSYEESIQDENGNVPAGKGIKETKEDN
ncbi:MAG: hypothetical protein ABIJ42_07035 [Acidobacteriota bacterium]